MRIAAFAVAIGMTTITGTAMAGVPVQVTVTGEVEQNQISFGPFGDVNPGDPVEMSFLVDSNNFVDNMNNPTRGYEIDQASFSMTLGPTTVGLQDPYPAGQTPYFVVRNDDPGVDGFFLGQNLNYPFGGIPTSETGQLGQFAASYSVTYEGDTLDSLDIVDAAGTYDFDGLTVFNFGIDDGFVEGVLLIVFEQMTIEVIPAPGVLALLIPAGFMTRRRRG